MVERRDLTIWEPEETVGKLWDAFASRLEAPETHDGEAVTLGEMRGRLGVLFRGLGGAREVEIAAVARSASRHRLSRLRRLGAEYERVLRPSFDGETLRLPSRIADFPERKANEAAFLWLTAAAAHAVAPAWETDPLRADLALIRAQAAIAETVVDACPGLQVVWRRLAEACLALRPRHRLPPAEALVEETVRAVLQGARPAPLGETTPTAPRNYRPFAPVPIWLDLRSISSRAQIGRTNAPDPGGGEDGEGEIRAATRREAEQAERRDSLILHRFEAMLSWANFLNVNRKVEDDDDEGARKAAKDADEITLADIAKRPATRLKLDLHLSPAEAERERLSGEHLYPEWDARRRDYAPDHCRVLAAPGEAAEATPFDDAARRRIRAVRRRFEALRPTRVALARQIEGDDIDLDAAVRAQADLTASGVGSDRVWRATRPEARGLAVMILLDASRSTESACGERRVIDVEREALTALAWGLDACGDDIAIRAFSSLRRDRVFVHEIKEFGEPMGPGPESRIAGLKPGFYTRLGAAIRHVSQELATRLKQRRLALVITDGKPNDLDHYEGRHGVEDSRMAVLEARRLGLVIYAIAVADAATPAHARIFGANRFAVTPNPEKLTAALPDIYRQLVA